MLQRNNIIWEMFSKFFKVNFFYAGEITLSYGDHNIVVNSIFKPKNVWLSLEQPEDSVPVCCGNVSLVGAKIQNRKITINAKIRSEVARVEYFIQF